jgi:hypothetical protein
MNVFKRLARRITVADLQTPLGPTLQADTDVGDAFETCMEAADGQGYNAFERVSLVLNDAREATHYIWSEAIDSSAGIIGEIAEPLRSTLLVSGDTNALDAVKLLGTRDKPYAFVLCSSEITGVVSWADFYKPEFAMCMLALLLEVEQECLEVALRDPATAWSKLTPLRQAKAREVYAVRYNLDSEKAGKAELLRCTTFIDKKTLITDSTDVAPLGRQWLRAFFQQAEQYRNYFSHTGEDVRIGGVQGLANLISDAERLMAVLRPPIDTTSTFKSGSNI